MRKIDGDCDFGFSRFWTVNGNVRDWQSREERGVHSDPRLAPEDSRSIAS